MQTKMMSSRKELSILIGQIEEIVKTGNEIFEKAGGQTRGQIDRVGETKHLEDIEKLAGEYWLKALPLAAKICKEKGIVDINPIRKAYAKKGIFGFDCNGAMWVAESISQGDNKNCDDYYPIGHLNGMVAALRYVLNRR